MVLFVMIVINVYGVDNNNKAVEKNVIKKVIEGWRVIGAL